MEEKTLIKDGSYVTIQAFMVKDLGLTGAELICYAIIYGFSQDGEQEYRGTIQYLMDWNGCSRQTIFRALQSLLSKGLLLRREEVINGVRFVRYKAVYDEWCKAFIPSPKDDEDSSDNPKLDGGCQNVTPYPNEPFAEYQDDTEAVPSCEGGGTKLEPNKLEDNLENKLDDREKETLKKKTPKGTDPLIVELCEIGYVEEREIPSYAGVISRNQNKPREVVEAAFHKFMDNLRSHPENMYKGFPYFDNFIKEVLER